MSTSSHHLSSHTRLSQARLGSALHGERQLLELELHIIMCFNTPAPLGLEPCCSAAPLCCRYQASLGMDTCVLGWWVLVIALITQQNQAPWCERAPAAVW